LTIATVFSHVEDYKENPGILLNPNFDFKDWNLNDITKKAAKPEPQAKLRPRAIDKGASAQLRKANTL